eukprot:CAMPEP_0171606582 /NCGR_PEP_ID=MMETSP0990-20121206/7844_1 /TAXON_ID=483369 /ORGANISM="non described non described, Strain CCMP2098" /LENGTH=322 /DNA_ID=CAMNT_0012169437 /DNA_START=24 /DNA_END=992 /DNA_ORIENTATION=-
MAFMMSRSLRAALVVAEHSGNVLSQSTLSAVTAASKFGEITMLVSGSNCKEVAKQASHVGLVKRVLLQEDSGLANCLAENTALAVASAVEGGEFTHVVVPSSNNSKNYLPRVAAVLDVAPITDVIEIVSGDTFVRPMYAGNALSTVQSSDNLRVLSVRSTAFEKAADDSTEPCPVDIITGAGFNADMSTFVSEAVSSSERPDLTAASVVVSGGRGMKSGENFGMLEELADKLGGAVGASRAAVDAGFVPNEYQVGQTGKVVAPDLYIAVGISGAIQHLSGMKDSKTIVAVNKDADAPIFQVADYGLVADLFDAVPELTQKVK